jgi:hypothetical protein
MVHPHVLTTPYAIAPDTFRSCTYRCFVNVSLTVCFRYARGRGLIRLWWGSTPRFCSIRKTALQVHVLLSSTSLLMHMKI